MISRVLRNTLVVRDQEEAFRFYTEKLGFEKRADQPIGEKTRWLTIAPKEDHNLEFVLQPLDWFDGKAREENAASDLTGSKPWRKTLMGSSWTYWNPINNILYPKIGRGHYSSIRIQSSESFLAKSSSCRCLPFKCVLA